MSISPFFDQSLLPYSGLAFRMVQVPAGACHIGSLDDDPDAFGSEKPRHLVQLDAFWLAETPVTQALWKAVMGTDPSYFKGGQRPVEQVSWFDAAVFCNALSTMTARRPVYLDPKGQPFGRDGQQWTLPNEGEVQRDREADGYCLPTEAQWEYAARAGSDEPLRFTGSDLLGQVGWYAENSGGETRDTCLLLPNALGLYDMSGNVWEWCEDWYGGYTAAMTENPRGPAKGDLRVLRGGGRVHDPQGCRPAYRNSGRPDGRGHFIGFRLALQSVG